MKKDDVELTFNQKLSAVSYDDDRLRQFNLRFAYEKVFSGPSMEPYIHTVTGWTKCTYKEEGILNGMPTEVYTRNGIYTYANNGLGVSASTYSDYLAGMVTALRSGILDDLEADGSAGIKGA